MPTGLFDIADRAPVFHGKEINAFVVEAMKSGVTQIDVKDHAGVVVGAMSLEQWRDVMLGRWQRVCATAELIDHIRAGMLTLVDSVATSTQVH